MEIGDLSVKLKDYQQKVLDALPVGLQEVANTMISDVKGRVSQGMNYEGQPFSPYSTRTMLVGRKSFKTGAAWAAFGGQSKQAKGLKGKRGVKATQPFDWRTIKRGGGTYRLMLLEGGYKKLRELHSKSSDKKIFFWEGTMMNSIMAYPPEMSGTRASIIYKPNIGYEAQKMKWLQDREGTQIMMPSKAEVDHGTQTLTKIINRV
ncbi:MAG: hypothetical protein WC341_07755 [Bacteroidales bacterium]|jgi:hypothetical protein